jgi:hypothetical protein
VGGGGEDRLGVRAVGVRDGRSDHRDGDDGGFGRSPRLGQADLGGLGGLAGSGHAQVREVVGEEDEISRP